MTLPKLMVGREVMPPAVMPREPGKSVLVLRNVSTLATASATTPLDAVSLAIDEGEIVGLAGVSGNGQASLAGLLSGTLSPSAGDVWLKGEPIGDWSPRAALAHGIGRIPEDRHTVGTIADMSLTENVISERYASPRFARHGLLDWPRARSLRRSTSSRDYDIKAPCPPRHASGFCPAATCKS